MFATYLEYFGTYFKHLPTSPTSHHSDTFQLIQDQSQLDPRHLKTLYTAELLFFLGTPRISMPHDASLVR